MKINGLDTTQSKKKQLKEKRRRTDTVDGGAESTETGDPVEDYCQNVISPPDEDCCICIENLNQPSSHESAKGASSISSHVKELKKCHHMFHTSCLKAMYQSGSKDGSLQCPTCKTIHGVKHGNQPDSGTMVVRKNALSLPGYESYGSYNIIYDFRGGIQGQCHPHPGKRYTARGFPRSCFLPDNKKGQEVLELLKIAWNRKLIFTIGTSTTSGETDTVIWNEIHHKTESCSNHGGHGYPDPNYLDNVSSELVAHGVVATDIEESMVALR